MAFLFWARFLGANNTKKPQEKDPVSKPKSERRSELPVDTGGQIQGIKLKTF
jgi:hypothetical protein